jgi:hypothetical protein
VAHPQIAVFARMAEGNARPVRKLEGQLTQLGRTMHGIAYDATRDEFYVPQPFAQAILTFRGAAAGEEKPIRVIQGSNTRLSNTDKVENDPVNNELLVSEDGVILVFDRTANGNVAPKRMLTMTDDIDIDAVSVDYVHNVIIAANPAGSKEEKYPRLLFLDRGAAGEVKPLRVVGGRKSLLTGTFGMRAYSAKGYVLVAMPGPITSGAHDASFIGVWSTTQDNGDAAPRWTIGGPFGELKQPRGIDLDVKGQNVIVSDKVLNAVLTYHFPEIF